MQTCQTPAEKDFEFTCEISLKLLLGESVTVSEWNDLFSAVHTLTKWDENQKELIYLAIQKQILSTIERLQAKLPTECEPDVYLKTYTDEWKSFFLLCQRYSLPFVKLEAHDGSDRYNVRNLMLQSWNESIFSDKKEDIYKSVMKLIEAERNGQACDPQLIIGIRESYVNLCTTPEDNLSLYREFFEKAYFEDTRKAFYGTNAQEYLRVNGVENYMKYADLRLSEEIKRAEKYLDASSRQELTKICGDVLVFPVKEVVLAECGAMITRNDIDNLLRMFHLLNLVPECIPPMLVELEECIVKAGLADMVAAAETIVQDSEKYVQQLLDLFNRSSELVEKAFENDPRFLSARDKAFKKIVNDSAIFKLGLASRTETYPESKCSELLANFCVKLLSKTSVSKKLTSEIVESRFEGVLLLLKYVQNKDVSMIRLQSHLTKRLILENLADNDIVMEENMLEWLRDV